MNIGDRTDMSKCRTYPGLYIIEDSDTHVIVSELCAQGYYIIILRNRAPENETLFGRHYYDYSDTTLTCCAPELAQAAIYIKKSLPCRWILAFRPELLKKGPSEKDISDYTFFFYRPNEALHLSIAETKVITSCIDDICTELLHSKDHYSSRILAKHIGRVLDYTIRFYERQFITRDLIVEKIISHYDKLLEEYMIVNQLCIIGLPTARYCADRLRLSEVYFCDVLKHKTGYTHDSYVQIKRIEIAKQKLAGTNQPVQQIVTDLGFPSVQYFCYLFKKLTGYTPNCYRTLH